MGAARPGFPFERRRPKVASIPGPSDRIPDRRPGPSKAQEHPWSRSKSRTPRDPRAWDARPKILPLKGIETEFFTIGQLATALHRSKYTVVDWIRKGSCPSPATEPRPTEHRLGKGIRLWSRAQVEGIQRIAEEEGILGEQRRRRQTRSAAHQRFAERTSQLMQETR